MKKTEEKKDYPKISPMEFELILERYGMSKAKYCGLRGKCRSWFYEVLRPKSFVPVIDMDTLANEIGYSVLIQLANEVKVNKEANNE